MTDEERLEMIDITGETSPEEDVIWALNYLLNLPVEDDLPYIMPASKKLSWQKEIIVIK